MHWCSRLGMFWGGGIIIPTVVLLGCNSPGLATLTPLNLSEGKAEPIDMAIKAIKVAQQNPPAPLENPQPDPNEERFLQPVPAPSPTPSEESPVITPTPSPEQEPGEQSQPIQVTKIDSTLR